MRPEAHEKFGGQGYTIVVARWLLLVPVTGTRPIQLDVEHSPDRWTWCETSHSDNVDCQNSVMTLDRYNTKMGELSNKVMTLDSCNSRASAGHMHPCRADLIQVSSDPKQLNSAMFFAVLIVHLTSQNIVAVVTAHINSENTVTATAARLNYHVSAVIKLVTQLKG